MLLLPNSIIGVEKAQSKLKMAFDAHFKNNAAKFEIGVDPKNGRYTIVVIVDNARFVQALPTEVDGYKVTTSNGKKQPNRDSNE